MQAYKIHGEVFSYSKLQKKGKKKKDNNNVNFLQVEKI